MWKFHDLSVIQILREISFGEFWVLTFENYNLDSFTGSEFWFWWISALKRLWKLPNPKFRGSDTFLQFFWGFQIHWNWFHVNYLSISQCEKKAWIYSSQHFPATLILREINFGTFKKVKNCHFNNFEGFECWFIEKFHTWKCQKLPHFKIQSFSNGQNGSFWGLQNDQYWFHGKSE